MSDYNGWTNYETWNVALWLDNDQGTYEMMREWAVEVWGGVKDTMVVSYLTREERAIRLLADLIQEWVEDNNPLKEGASMYSDILSANLHEVNWGEIAKGQIEEVDKEAEVTPAELKEAMKERQ